MAARRHWRQRRDFGDELGIELNKQARKPLPRPVYDELSGED